MAGWTIETLKAHYDAIMTEKDLRYQQRFDAGEKRLDGMNEFREALKDAAGKYVTRTEALAMVLAACTITGTVVGVLTFFMRK